MQSLTKTCEDGNIPPQPASIRENAANTSGSQENINASPDCQHLSVALFHDVPVRIVKQGKDAMFPIADIAGALKYDRQSLHGILERNSELFDGYRRVSVTLTGSDPTKHTCLTRDGVIALLVKIDYQRIKDPTKRQRIIEFQRWAAETLGKVMDGTIGDPKTSPWMPALKDHLSLSKALIDVGHVDPQSALAIAIAEASKETGCDFSPYLKLLDAVELGHKWIHSEIASRVMGCDLIRFTNLCFKYGFLIQTPVHGTRLTPKGRCVAREFPYTEYHGAVRYQQIWDEASIRAGVITGGEFND